MFLRSGRVLIALVITADERGVTVENIWRATRNGQPDPEVPIVESEESRYMVAFIPWNSIDFIAAEPQEVESPAVEGDEDRGDES